MKFLKVSVQNWKRLFGAWSKEGQKPQKEVFILEKKFINTCGPVA